MLAIPYPAIDPIALQLGPISVKWYGLAYVAGLLLGWLYIKRLLATPGRRMSMARPSMCRLCSATPLERACRRALVRGERYAEIVADSGALYRSISRLLCDEATRRTLAKNAAACVAQAQGASTTILDHLAFYLTGEAA